MFMVRIYRYLCCLTYANARQTVMFCGRKGIATRPQLNLQ